jgi:predicted MPP superfamily phosphohydrolase
MGLTIFIFVGIIQAILAFGHFVLYKTFISVFSVTGVNSLLWSRAGFIFLAISFVIGSLLSFNYYNWFSRGFYTFAAVWLGFLLYFLIASLIYWVLIIISLNFGSTINPALVGKILFAAALAAGFYGIVHANTIVVTSIKVNLPNLPENWNGKKAVFVSDLHLGQVRGVNFAEKVTSRINSLKPDIIFVGGDVYDGVKVPESDVVAPLNNLVAPNGKYFVSGNHEEFRDGSIYFNNLKNIGLRILNNEVVDVKGLQVAGVDYNDTETRSDFGEVLKQINIANDRASILLKHAPSNLDLAEQKGFSMFMAGHTHRAQMFPLNAFTYRIYKGYDYGLKYFGKMLEFTSSGVGTWGPPIRVGSRSEIVEVIFE